MTTFTATQARENLFTLVSKTVKGHVPIKITSKRGNAVLISADDYKNLMETLDLLSIPGFAISIKKARADIKAGRTKSLKGVFGK